VQSEATAQGARPGGEGRADVGERGKGRPQGCPARHTTQWGRDIHVPPEQAAETSISAACSGGWVRPGSMGWRDPCMRRGGASWLPGFRVRFIRAARWWTMPGWLHTFPM